MMDEYEVIVTPDAENELNELDDYITFELLSPETAVAYVAFIKNELACTFHVHVAHSLSTILGSCKMQCPLSGVQFSSSVAEYC